jgi:hypothetical protein
MARRTGTLGERLHVIILITAQRRTQDTPNNPGSKQKAGPTKFSHDRWRRRWCFHRHNKISSGHRSANARKAQQTCQPNRQNATSHGLSPFQITYHIRPQSCRASGCNDDSHIKTFIIIQCGISATKREQQLRKRLMLSLVNAQAVRPPSWKMARFAGSGTKPDPRFSFLVRCERAARVAATGLCSPSRAPGI